MKRLLLAILLVSPFLSYCQMVDIFESKQIARNFLEQRELENPEKSPVSLEIINSETIAIEEIPVMYTHFLESGGFVLVSADKKVRPVLGYSYTGTDMNSEKPEAYSFWINQYEKAIHHAIVQETEASKETQALWDALESGESLKSKYRAVEPMLTSTWNQGRFYNTMCPIDPDGPDGHCYTGCVATAMGQLMNYFRWPETGTGSYSYLHPDYGTISADYENTTYQWDGMEDDLSGYNMQIAEMLFHAGVGVDMVYGPNGSGMYNHSAAYVLRTYFKYCPETQYIFRDSTTLDWDSIVLSNLNHQRPLYYAGWTSDTTIGIYGHAFVCDGYETEDYFHFNWGWGGSYDGYFYLDNLTPGSNFNYGQEVITNMWPDTLNNTYPNTIPECIHLNYINGTLTDGSGPLDYTPGTAAEWLLAPGSDDYDSISAIEINFSQFDITENDGFLRIYDGGSNDAPLLAEYTGTVIPEEIITSADSAFITFSAGTTASSGWKLSYNSVIPEYCSGMTSITEEAGVVSDGSGEKMYTGNNLCRFWIKDVGDWDNLFLNFDFIELADERDMIEVFDPTNSNTLAIFTGPLVLTDYMINAPNNQAFIYFTSNGIGNADGFEASFQRSMVGMDELDEKESIQVFPQPADDEISIIIPNTFKHNGVVELIDIKGALTSFNIEENQQNINLSVSNLNSGIYFIRIPGSEKALVKRVIVF